MMIPKPKAYAIAGFYLLILSSSYALRCAQMSFRLLHFLAHDEYRMKARIPALKIPVVRGWVLFAVLVRFRMRSANNQDIARGCRPCLAVRGFLGVHLRALRILVVASTMLLLTMLVSWTVVIKSTKSRKLNDALLFYTPCCGVTNYPANLRLWKVRPSEG